MALCRVLSNTEIRSVCRKLKVEDSVDKLNTKAQVYSNTGTYKIHVHTDCGESVEFKDPTTIWSVWLAEG